MNDYRNQHNARSPPQELADRKNPFYTVFFHQSSFRLMEKNSPLGVWGV